MRRQVLTVTPPPIPTLLLEPGAVLPCPVAPQVTKSLSGCWGRLGLGAPQWPSSPLKGAGGRACEVPARLFCEWTSSLEEWNPRQSLSVPKRRPPCAGFSKSWESLGSEDWISSRLPFQQPGERKVESAPALSQPHPPGGVSAGPRAARGLAPGCTPSCALPQPGRT